jgi:hypothetical protein
MDDHVRATLEALPEDRRRRVELAVAEERRRRRRALVWSIGIFVLALVLAAVMFALTNRGRNPPADGIPATARVDRAPDGRCPVGERGSHCFGLELTVFPSDGRSYPARVDVLVPDRWAVRIQPGSFVTVVVDPRDPTKVFLDQDAFAEPAPAAPSGAH